MAYPTTQERAKGRYFLLNHGDIIAEVESEEELLWQVPPSGTFACRLSDGTPLWQFLPELPDGGYAWVYIGGEATLPKRKFVSL